jgi:pimeloyl-ACP methyl ester carboxylesterase
MGIALMPSLFTMRTGRTLEVHEYGDPAGRPIFFFHGLIGSHHQASYVADQAKARGLRIIAPNRPGVGASEFLERASVLESVDDVEDVAAALGIDDFSLIGISGGTPYALAALHRLAERVRTVTILSGMGPSRLRGALQGMERRRRLFFELGSRSPKLARRTFEQAEAKYRDDPTRFLKSLVRTWSAPDRRLFDREDVFNLFLKDLQQVFESPAGPAGMAQELGFYRNYGFAIEDLPGDKRVTLWLGLDDSIVPPVMAWRLAQALPNSEAHLVPGGHFVAIEIADQVMDRLDQQLREAE